jgi:hypothetical protein
MASCLQGSPIGEIDMTQDKIREIKNLVDIWGKNPATLEFSNLILGLVWSIVRERVEVEVEQV